MLTTLLTAGLILTLTDRPIDRPACCAVPHADASEHFSAARDVGGTARGGSFCPDCVIQLHVIADHALFQQLGAGTSAYITQLVDAMDGAWSRPVGAGGMGIGVTLAGATVFEAGDPWAPATDAGELLVAVRNYAQVNLPVDGVGRDAVLMLTSVDLDGSTIGLSFVSTLCRPNAAGVVQVVGSDLFTLQNANHQLGHIAGALHDGAGNSCVSQGFIMEAVSTVNNPRSDFSACSVAFVSGYVTGSPGNPGVLDLLAPPAGCAADLAPPAGVLNFFDFAAFLSLYNAGDPAADLAAPLGSFNFFDVTAYLGLFNAGCP